MQKGRLSCIEGVYDQTSQLELETRVRMHGEGEERRKLQLDNTLPAYLFFFLSVLVNVLSSCCILPHRLTRAREPDCQLLAGETCRKYVLG